MKNFDLKTYLSTQKQIVEEQLAGVIPATLWPAHLKDSMNYSLNAGGKRLRPILVLAASDCLGGQLNAVLPVALALEMIHTYSLIHDDLPAMDNDDLRRGKATNHKVYGDATAILAGDGLLTEAFRILASHSHPQFSASTLLEVIASIAAASGIFGMVAGQAADLEAERKQISLEELERLHHHKTGCLIRVSLEAGAKLSGANPSQLKALQNYGNKIGLAFQIADDVLDIIGGEEIGKDVGSDQEKDKSTYPKLLGVEGSQKLAGQLVHEAIETLHLFDEKADPLRSIARYIIERKK